VRKEAEAATHTAEVARREAVAAAELARLRTTANRRLAYNANQRYIQLLHELGGDSTLGSETMITGWIPEPGGEDLRGWEWYFNYGRINRKQKSFRIGSTVTSVAFTPFGKRLAASGPCGTESRERGRCRPVSVCRAAVAS